LVGTAGFEPATPCPPDKYATRLRYAPNALAECLIIIKQKNKCLGELLCFIDYNSDILYCIKREVIESLLEFDP